MTDEEQICMYVCMFIAFVPAGACMYVRIMYICMYVCESLTGYVSIVVCMYGEQMCTVCMWKSHGVKAEPAARTAPQNRPRK